MKRNHIHFITIVFALYILAGFLACVCKPCNDPNLIAVPKAVAGEIQYHWEMIQAIKHAGGAATTSIQIIPSGTSSVNSIAADSVTTSIILVANDTFAGVKCLRLHGGFGLTCNNADLGAAIAIDGIVESKISCMNLSTCCLRSNSLRYDDLGQHMHCGTGKIFNNGGIGLTGIIENCKGVADTVNLTINFS